MNGKKGLRWPRTFAAHGAWRGSVSDVREVAVVDQLHLAEIWDEIRLIVVEGSIKSLG